MPSTYRLHRLAQKELDRSIKWYFDQEGKKLATRFLQNYQLTISQILVNPFQFPEIQNGLRKALMSKFPFVIIFNASEDDIYVLAIFHTSRNPNQWQKRN